MTGSPPEPALSRDLGPDESTIKLLLTPEEPAP